MEKTTLSKDFDGIKTYTSKESLPGKMSDGLHMEPMVLRWKRKQLEKVQVKYFFHAIFPSFSYTSMVRNNIILLLLPISSIERVAYRFSEIKYKNETNSYQLVGQTMVAKNSILANEKVTKDFHYDFCRVQSKAYDLAEKFNHAVRLATRLRPISDESRPPELKFILCHVYTYTNIKTKEETAVLVERFLKGKFTKYNSNNGYVKEAIDGVNNTRTIELVSGKVRLEEFLQAFSHWVYVQSDHQMVICDLQGVLNEEGRYPEFVLTDPAICTSKKTTRFGKTDMKLPGIRRFCSKHRCGIVCRGLGLPCITTSSSVNDERKRAAT